MKWIDERLAAYEHVCRVYDDCLERLDLVCEKGCDTCCTVNVTVTSLEAWRIAAYLREQDRPDLMAAIRSALDGKRYHPALTMNAIAGIYSQGVDVPEEVMDPSWGGCPLLTSHTCPIYAVRPFSCRCMVSSGDCRTTGYARADAFTVTINNVMMQYIEHVDQGGFTGNMLDMVVYMADAEISAAYSRGEHPAAPVNGIANAPAPVLLAQPEDRQKLAPILNLLNAQES